VAMRAPLYPTGCFYGNRKRTIKGWLSGWYGSFASHTACFIVVLL
jgi:hypothetical protein